MLNRIKFFLLIFIFLLKSSDLQNNSQTLTSNEPQEVIELQEDSPDSNIDIEEDDFENDTVSSDDGDSQEFDLSSEDVEVDDDDPKKLILLDKLEAVVAEGDNFHAIATSDISKMNFVGRQHTVDDVIDTDLLDILASKMKMNVDENDINKYLQRMHLSKEQIQNIAKTHGMSDTAEFYELFKTMYRSSQAMSFKIQSELVFTEEEILKYCEENPIVESAIYTLETAFVPFSKTQTHDDQYADLIASTKGDKHINILWNPPFDLNESEISDANNFIFNMVQGQVVVQKAANGFDLYKLIKLKSRKELSLTERRIDVVNTLKSQRYEDVVKKIMNDLRKSATILTPSFVQYPVPVYASDISE